MSDLEAVAVKLPTFWTSSPAAWFAQAEAQFAIRKITDDATQYYYVVSALDNATATRALSLITSPPSTEKYRKIKSFLTSAYDLSDVERAAALFSLPGLGDSKPSELMDTMLGLLGTHSPCFLFMHLFLQQLPDYVRAPLASSTITDSRRLALEADKIYLSGRNQQASVQEVNKKTSKPSYPPNQIIDNMCWYHRRFGAKACKCGEGCKHFSSFRKNQGNGNMGQR